MCTTISSTSYIVSKALFLLFANIITMADQQYSTVQESETSPKLAGESLNCEMFLNKEQNQKLQEDAAMTDAKTMKEEEKTTLMEELHRSKSNSSSSSDEEDEGREKKKKKKGLKEKLSGEKEEADTKCKDTFTPVEKGNEVVNAEATNPEDKKGFIEKIKEKLPGHHKKAEDGFSAECATNEHSPEGEPKEKKGILEKIKEKLPGCHKNEEEKKDN